MSEKDHDADWTHLMDVVHNLIYETGIDCPESTDSEHDPLCYSIASGLWLEGWKQAQPPPEVPAGADVAEVLAGLVEEIERILPADNTRSMHWSGLINRAHAAPPATGPRAAGGARAAGNPWTAQSEDLLPHCAPFPDTPGSRCPDHYAVACPVCLADREVHDAIYAVQTAQDFESPDAPYQHDVLVFASHARVLAATLREFYEALSGEAQPAPSAPGVAELLAEIERRRFYESDPTRHLVMSLDEIVRLLAPGGADGEGT